MEKKFEAGEWLGKGKSPDRPERTHRANDILDDIETVTRRIETSRTDITSGYAAWRDIGFALCDALGEDGRDYFHRVSRFNPQYTEQEADSQYDKCLRSHGTGITIRTFFQSARDAGISISVSSFPSQTSKTSNPSTPASEGKSANAPSFSPSEETEEIEGNEGNGEEEQLPAFSPEISGRLPELLRKVVGKADSPADGDVLLLGSLTVISACLPNVMGIYNKRPVWANLFLFVTARASSGKGRLALCRYLIDPIHERLRDLNEIEVEQYNEALQRYNANRRKAELSKPEEPPLRMLFIPANSSATAVYQVLGENEGQGIMFETEGDTLVNTFSSDYGNYSDGFRKAFHHEAISYVRRKDREYVNLRHPRLSTVLSGTPRQLLALVTDAENGLFSRFIFYYLRTGLEWQDVFSAEPDGTLDDYFQHLGEEFTEFYTTLKEYGDIRFAFSEDQGRMFNSWFQSVQTDYAGRYGDDIIASIRRLGLTTFRIAMILSSLRMMDSGTLVHSLVCLDEDFSSAMAIARTVLVHTTRVLRELPRTAASLPSGNSQRTVRLQLFLDRLPGEFDRRTFIDVAASLGIPLKTAERNIRQWCEQGTLIHLAQGKYTKPNTNVQQ